MKRNLSDLQLQEAFEQVSQEGAQSKQVLQTATQKESKATSMVNELTAVRSSFIMEELCFALNLNVL